MDVPEVVTARNLLDAQIREHTKTSLQHQDLMFAIFDEVDKRTINDEKMAELISLFVNSEAAGYFLMVQRERERAYRVAEGCMRGAPLYLHTETAKERIQHLLTLAGESTSHDQILQVQTSAEIMGGVALRNAITDILIAEGMI